jgi:LacI family transcriptional regulator
MVTLKDVARAARVHTTTASSVLNKVSGNTRFSEKTRRKIHKTAKRLGYSQNRIASSLRTRKTGTVGLVAGNIQNPFFAALSLQLERHLREKGYDLVFTCHGADSANDERDLALMLLGRSVDGLLIWSEQRNGRTLSLRNHRTTTPRVWIGHGPRNEPAATIAIAEGLELALKHIRASGCNRLGYYAPSYAQHAGLPNSRPDILDEVCRKLGMPPAVRLFFPEQSWNLGAAVQCAPELIESARREGVDAVLAYNDISAVGWHIAARQQSFPVPVIGFDGSPLIKAWRPEISHVDLHSDALAEMAVSLLVTLMKGETPPEKRPHVHPTFVMAAG